MKLVLYKKVSILCLLFAFANSCCANNLQEQKTPVDYVNPYMGNISHLLVPTYPTVHLPYSMLRVYPERTDYTSDLSGASFVVSLPGRSHADTITFPFPQVK